MIKLYSPPKHHITWRKQACGLRMGDGPFSPFFLSFCPFFLLSLPLQPNESCPFSLSFFVTLYPSYHLMIPFWKLQRKTIK